MSVSMNCFIATFRRFSAKSTRRGVARPSKNSIPKTACSMCRRAASSAAPPSHFVYTPHGEPQALHNAGRLAWGSGPRGEAPEYTGLDVIIVRDGKIATLYG